MLCDMLYVVVSSGVAVHVCDVQLYVCCMLYDMLYVVWHVVCCALRCRSTRLRCAVTCCMLYDMLYVVWHVVCCALRCRSTRLRCAVTCCMLYVVWHVVCCMTCCMLLCPQVSQYTFAMCSYMLYVVCCMTCCMLYDMLYVVVPSGVAVHVCDVQLHVVCCMLYDMLYVVWHVVCCALRCRSTRLQCAVIARRSRSRWRCCSSTASRSTTANLAKVATPHGHHLARLGLSRAHRSIARARSLCVPSSVCPLTFWVCPTSDDILISGDFGALLNSDTGCISSNEHSFPFNRRLPKLLTCIGRFVLDAKDYELFLFQHSHWQDELWLIQQGFVNGNKILTWQNYTMYYFHRLLRQWRYLRIDLHRNFSMNVGRGKSWMLEAWFSQAGHDV